MERMTLRYRSQWKKKKEGKESETATPKSIVQHPKSIETHP